MMKQNKTRLLHAVKKWEFFVIMALFFELAVFGILNPSFLNLENLLYTTSDFAHICLVALPLTLVIITGGIDISIASIMGLSSILTGSLWQLGMPIGLSISFGLLGGLLAGVLNGILVANTDIPAMVITLGTKFLYAGLATGLAGSLGASGYNGIGGFPEGFLSLAYGGVGMIPNPLIFVVIVAVLLSVLLQRHRAGRSLYLIGDNLKAAKFSGIPIKRILVMAYSLTGICAGFAGVVLTSYFTSARADLGTDALLPAITAVVIGGTSITGGKGSVLGTFAASIFIGFLKQGLMSLGVTSDISQVVVGGFLVVTVAGKVGFAALRQRMMNRRAMEKTHAQVSV